MSNLALCIHGYCCQCSYKWNYYCILMTEHVLVACLKCGRGLIYFRKSKTKPVIVDLCNLHNGLPQTKLRKGSLVFQIQWKPFGDYTGFVRLEQMYNMFWKTTKVVAFSRFGADVCISYSHIFVCNTHFIY